MTARKHIALFAALLAGAMSMTAKQVTPEQAVANMESQQSQGGLFGAPTLKGNSLKHVFTLSDTKKAPLVYAYNVSGKDAGYVIASADDSAFPVLAYVDKGSFSEKEIPVQLREVMAYYGEQIAWLRSDKGAKARQPFVWSVMLKESRKPVKPMVKTLWNQYAPYNLMCPEMDGKKSVTGCMATAMAQVLAYWHWPKKASGKGTATCNGKVYHWDLSKIAFDFNKMTTYYTDKSPRDRQIAVAKLMAACGYAVGMNYSPTGSGASASVSDMVNFFHFKPTAELALLTGYTPLKWIDKIHSSLAAGCPVICWGYGSDYQSGHAFVIDGYQGLGYFHVNWGWGGQSDGYYRLTALIPGGDTTRDYGHYQRALVNLRPDK